MNAADEPSVRVSSNPQRPALQARGTMGAPALDAASDSGSGVTAISESGYGLCAYSSTGTAVYARSLGDSDTVIVLSEGGAGVSAISLGAGDGLRAVSAAGNGVHAIGGGATGGAVCPMPAGLFAEGGEGAGVYAVSTNGTGIAGRSERGPGVEGCSTFGAGVLARGDVKAGLALEVAGLIAVHAPVAGEVTLKTGERSGTVHTPAATGRSQIIVTPLGDLGQGVRLWIGARDAGSFTICLNRPVRRAVVLQFLIIN